MQERLAGIENLLQKLTTSNASASAVRTPVSSVISERASGSSTPRAGPKSILTPSHNDIPTVFDPEDVESFEGNSSLTAHAAFASELVSQAVQTSMLASTPFSAPNPRMEAAISSLRQMVNLQTTRGASSLESTSHNSKIVTRKCENEKNEKLQSHLPQWYLKNMFPLVCRVLYCRL